jgi:hypothetical protein
MQDVVVRTHSELDLTNQSAVRAFFSRRSLIKFIWQQLKWEVFMPITLIRQSSSTRT